MLLFCYLFLCFLEEFLLPLQNEKPITKGAAMARTKKTESVPVRIRFKELKNGNKSIYLDIYHERKRRYEFLKLYLIPETSAEAKAQNEHTLKAANAIKSQRIIDITNNKPPIVLSEKGKMLLIDWMNVYKEQGKQKGKRALEASVHSTVVQLKKYDSKAQLCDVDKEFLDGFVEYLKGAKSKRTKNPFAKKTIKTYLGYVISALNLAIDEGILSVNPGLAIDRKAIQGEQNKREYLTIDEVRLLIKTPCREDIKVPFLFSCFCGLRLSDVRSLVWKNVIEEGGKIHLEVCQRKTGRMLYLPLSSQAQRYLPEKHGDAEEHVFSIPHTTTIDVVLKRWAKTAGVAKNLCYHMSRHTFATMELTLGADLYTTSQLLGHRDVETTQVYAKIVDAKKEAAVLMIDALFD